MPETSALESKSEMTIADQFPILEQGLYFNHAAIGPWPRCATEAVQAFALENMQHGADGYDRWYARETSLRQVLAELTGATGASDIALLKNTSEGISLVAFGLDWQAGDNLVLPAGEFPSNRLPWLAQSSRGVEVREVDIRQAPDAEQALLDAMDSQTRLLSVSAVQWQDGFRLDLQRLGQACRKRGVLFFVDAIQQLGALPMDVDSCAIDFLAADAHKWLLGPEGIAVFYCSEDARPRLKLQQHGWHMVEHPYHFDREDFEPARSAKRFEAGSPNMLGQVAMYASARLLLQRGMDDVGGRVLANTDQLLREFERIEGVVLTSPSQPERRSGIVSFRHQRLASEDLRVRLIEAGVSIVNRGGSIRVSPHFYQGEPQIAEFLDILSSVTDG